MAHLKTIVPHLGRNLPPTLPQIRTFRAHLRLNFARNFHQIAPCTRRSAPRAPKILPAASLPRFSTPPERRLRPFCLLLDTDSARYAINVLSHAPHKYMRKIWPLQLRARMEYVCSLNVAVSEACPKVRHSCAYLHYALSGGFGMS